MGQLTTSAFQTYDPGTAGTIQPGPFALYSVAVDQIAPTQMNEGLAEVYAKISGWNLLTSAQLQGTALTDIEPVVIGPNGQLYLLNGHHTFTSLLDSVYGASNPTIYVNVVANYSNLTTQQFWTQMQSANLLLPLNDGVPQTVNTATGAPIPASLTALTDDPYRGLERSILKNKSSVLFPTTANVTGAVGANTPGLDKMNGFYADFIWADAYRNANGGLGLPYVSPGDIALAAQWNLNPNSTTTMPGIGTVKVAQLPGFILSQNVTVSTAITNATLAGGTLDGLGTFTGITSFNVGTAANPIILGTLQSGFVMQLGADRGFGVTLSGTNTYTGGTTILAGTLTVANDAALGAAAPPGYSIDPNHIVASVDAANGIIFNSLAEGLGKLKIGSSFSTSRPIAVAGEIATIDLNSNTLTLTGSIVSLGALGVGLSAQTGPSDLTVADSGSGGKLILAPTSGTNPTFFGNWIVSSGTLVVSSDAALGNTTGASYTIGQIDLDGGTFQAGASFNSVRSLFLTGGSTFDTNGFTTSFAGSMTDVQRTLTVKNSSTATAGAVTFGSFNVDATATLALSGGTKGETVTLSNGIVRSGVATVMIDPSSTTSLGATEKVFATTAPTLTNGIDAPWVITDNAGSASTNPYDFLTYGANGYVKATYTKVGSGSTGGIRAAGATDIVEQNGNGTLAANAQAYALKVDSGATITATGFTITLGNGSGQAGLIMSNGIIAGGTLAFGAAEADIFAKGSSVAISATLTGTNGFTLSGSGTLTVSALATMSGALSIDSGTLSLTVANAFANVSGVTLYNVKSSPPMRC
jgi:autotransporter-associated beta strand protein